jgi:hypothetical protein
MVPESWLGLSVVAELDGVNLDSDQDESFELRSRQMWRYLAI